MKIKITASCIIDSDDFAPDTEQLIERLEEDDGYVAFDTLMDSSELSTNDFQISVEPLD